MRSIARRSILAICLAGLYAAPTDAIELPGPNVPALLRVNSVRQIFFGPNIFEIDQRQVLISRGGGVLELVATAGSAGSSYFILGFRGLGTTEELARLGRALVEAKVGVQGDCTLGSAGIGHMEITWFGRFARQNTFRVKFQEGAPLPIDRCPVEVLHLVSRIEGFVSDAISHLPQD